MAEIHLAGSAPLVNLVLSTASRTAPGAAEPGEFTLRAFLSGRIDLTRAEAVLGVIEAGNPAQLDAALEQLAGGLSGPIVALRDHLLDVVAHLEANLDFTEEPDVDPLARDGLAGSWTIGRGSGRLARQLTERERPEAIRASSWSDPPTRARAGSSTPCWAAIARSSRPRPERPATTCPSTVRLRRADRRAGGHGRHRGAGDAVTAQAQAIRADQSAQADLLLVCRSADGDRHALAAGSRPDGSTSGPRAICAAGSQSPSTALSYRHERGHGRWAAGAAVGDRHGSASREAEEARPPAPVHAAAAVCAPAAALRSAARSHPSSSGGDELVAFDLRSPSTSWARSSAPWSPTTSSIASSADFASGNDARCMRVPENGYPDEGLRFRRLVWIVAYPGSARGRGNHDNELAASKPTRWAK